MQRYLHHVSSIFRSVDKFLNALDSRHRLLFLCLLTVPSFIILAYLTTDNILVTSIVAFLLFVLIFVTRHLWRPEDYGRNKHRRFSLTLLFLMYSSHTSVHQFVDDFIASLNSLPSFLQHLLTLVPTAAPSAGAQFALTSAVFAVNYFLRDTSAMVESSASTPDGLSESTLRQELATVGKILLAHLNDIDRETAWSSHNFEPLDALVEVKSHERRHRTLKELLPAIRANRRCRTFLVLGDPGSGKSVALRKLARDLVAEMSLTGKLPVYINLK